MSNIRTINIRKNIQKKNDEIANSIRDLRSKYGIKMIDIMGSIGSGKTSILKYISEQLKDSNILVINGDLATSIDAERIATTGATCLQINTGRGCHLDANQVNQALQEIEIQDYEVIFVENVGNLICPSSIDVGADYKVAVTSITEGPYVFEKHPVAFKMAEFAVLNKIDLAEAMELDADSIIKKAQQIYPGKEFLKTSTKTGKGMNELISRIIDY